MYLNMSKFFRIQRGVFPKKGKSPKIQYQTLANLQAPAKLILRGSLDDSDEFMSQLHQMGFTLGMSLQLRNNQLNSDFLIVTIGKEGEKKEVILSKNLGKLLLVEPLEG
jgi:hypothetical protein